MQNMCEDGGVGIDEKGKRYLENKLRDDFLLAERVLVELRSSWSIVGFTQNVGKYFSYLSILHDGKVVLYHRISVEGPSSSCGLEGVPETLPFLYSRSEKALQPILLLFDFRISGPIKYSVHFCLFAGERNNK